jgi:cell division protein FtsQ
MMTGRRKGAKRIDPSATRRRRRHWALALSLTASCALFAMAWIEGVIRLPEKMFAIKTIRVESTFEHVGRDEIAAIVAPYASAGFFNVDLKSIREALQGLPWIHTAAVRRVWPDTLHIVLIEQRPSARWGDTGLLNQDGDVFYPEQLSAADAGLPQLDGPPRTSRAVIAYYREVSDRIAPLGLHVSSVHMDARRAWELILGNGMRLTLGRRDAEEELGRFVRFYPLVAAHAGEIAGVDLRYTNGFAVRWRGAAGERRLPKKTGDSA